MRDNKTQKFITVLKDIECKQCSIIFHPRQSTTKFCSKQCEGLSKRKNNKRICLTCNLEFSKKGKTKYCSSKCYGVSLKKEKVIKVTKEIIYKIVKINCLYCNNEFTVTKARENTAKFCNKVCRGKYYSGEKSCHFKIDRDKLKISDRLYNDHRQKIWSKSVKDRDGWKCKINNKDCNGRLEAHHILNWVEYPELRYEINNGICLCHAHHPRGRVKEKRLSPYFMDLVSVSKI